MAHCSKYSKNAIGHLTKHYERSKDEKGEYIKFGNQQIDTSKTDLNYNLAPEQNQVEFIKNRLSEVHCLKRDDVKVMCSWVISSPKTLPQENEREFFELAYKHLETKYGSKNVVSAFVHNDETTPHMHFAFIPVVYDKKKDREKVSAKEVITKLELKSFHTDLQSLIDDWKEKNNYEFECDILNGATENGNMTIQELKANTLKNANEIESDFLQDLIEENNNQTYIQNELSQEIDILSDRREKLLEDINVLSKEKNVLESNLEGLQANEISLMKKFVQLPKIKPIYDRFCKEVIDRLQALKKSKLEENKQSEEPVNRSMNEWKKRVLELKESTAATKDSKNNTLDDFER